MTKKQQRQEELKRLIQKNRLTRLRFENAELRKALTKIVGYGPDDVPEVIGKDCLECSGCFDYYICCLMRKEALKALKKG